MLLARATLAASSLWYDGEVAADLRPVRMQPWLDWQRATAASMAGPRASPLFRDTANELDCYWRLESASGVPTLLSPEVGERALELSLLGSNLGWNVALAQLLEDAPVLDTVRRIGNTLAHPSLRITPTRPEGRVALGDGPVDRRLARAQADEPDLNALPVVRLSSHLVLFSPPTLLADDEEPVDPIQPQALVILHTQRVGLTQTQWVQGLSPAEVPLQPPQSRSVLSARQQVIPRWSVIGEVRWDQWLLTAQRGGLEFRPRPRWLVRAIYTQRPDPVTPEQKVMVTLSRRLRWRLPQDIDRWPLGQEVGAPGPWLPAIPDHQPSPLVRLVP